MEQVKKFKVSFEFETLPYNKKTYDALGPHFFEEWSDDIFAKEDLSRLFQDAIVHRLTMSMEIAGKDEENSQAHINYCNRMVKLYEQMRDSIKIETE